MAEFVYIEPEITPTSHYVIIEMDGGCEDLFPEKSRPSDACYDLKSKEDVEIPAKGFVRVQTGVHMEFPSHYEVIVRGRSGMANKGIYTHVGTVDCNYTGDVSVILYNFTNEIYKIKRGDRIAQFQIQWNPGVELIEGKVTTNEERGDKGFGSSGR